VTSAHPRLNKLNLYLSQAQALANFQSELGWARYPESPRFLLVKPEQGQTRPETLVGGNEFIECYVIQG